MVRVAGSGRHCHVPTKAAVRGPLIGFILQPGKVLIVRHWSSTMYYLRYSYMLTARWFYS